MHGDIDAVFVLLLSEKYEDIPPLGLVRFISSHSGMYQRNPNKVFFALQISICKSIKDERWVVSTNELPQITSNGFAVGTVRVQSLFQSAWRSFPCLGGRLLVPRPVCCVCV